MLTKTQLIWILGIIIQVAGQFGFSAYAETLQTIGTAIISILVLLGLIQIDEVKTKAKKLETAMIKAKLLK